MDEVVVSKNELLEFFNQDKIVDTKDGWVFGDYIVDIVAIHSIEPKYLQDITNAKLYKIVPRQFYAKKQI